MSVDFLHGPLDHRLPSSDVTSCGVQDVPWASDKPSFTDFVVAEVDHLFALATRLTMQAIRSKPIATEGVSEVGFLAS